MGPPNTGDPIQKVWIVGLTPLTPPHLTSSFLDSLKRQELGCLSSKLHPTRAIWLCTGGMGIFRDLAVHSVECYP